MVIGVWWEEDRIGSAALELAWWESVECRGEVVKHQIRQTR